jgi:hypothetical protein
MENRDLIHLFCRVHIAELCRVHKVAAVLSHLPVRLE